MIKTNLVGWEAKKYVAGAYPSLFGGSGSNPKREYVMFLARIVPRSGAVKRIGDLVEMGAIEVSQLGLGRFEMCVEVAAYKHTFR